MIATDTMPLFFGVSLDGVYTWARPRKVRGVMRYSNTYTVAREKWQWQVYGVVQEAQWTAPPRKDRLTLDMFVYGGANKDLDRIVTAVCDALQNGQAILDDRQFDQITVVRLPKDKHGERIWAQVGVYK